jgi:hypothetical protein
MCSMNLNSFYISHIVNKLPTLHIHASWKFHLCEKPPRYKKKENAKEKKNQGGIEYTSSRRYLVVQCDRTVGEGKKLIG